MSFPFSSVLRAKRDIELNREKVEGEGRTANLRFPHARSTTRRW